MYWLVAHFQIFRSIMEVKFDAYVLCVTFGQKVPKLNSRPVYCSRLYSSCARFKQKAITTSYGQYSTKYQMITLS